MKNRQILAAIIIGAVALGALMLVAAMQKFPGYDVLRHITFGMAGSMTVASVGAGVLFLLGRRDFKAGPRKAYLLLCWGVILFGISQVQLPLIEFFELSSLLSSGAGGIIGIPYLLSVIFITMGMRTLVRSLGIVTRWVSLPWIIGTAFAAAALSLLMPHGPIAGGPMVFMFLQINGAFAIFVVVFYLFAARQAWLIHEKVGPFYKQAMVWLFVGLMTVVVAGLHLYAEVRFFQGSWYVRDGMAIPPVFIASVILMMAGYFTLAIRQRFNEAAIITTRSGSGLLDMVIYSASLASKPRDIAPLLDPVRKITSTGMGANFTAEQEEQLYKTYMKVEVYLVNQEPLRPFDTNQLREQMVTKFNLPPRFKSQLLGR